MAQSIYDMITGDSDKSLTLTMVIYMVIMGVIVLQILSMILDQLFGIGQLRLGPAIILLAIGATLVGISMATISPQQTSTKTLWAIFMSIVIVMGLYFIAPEIVPEIFEAGVLQFKVALMAVLGM